MKIRSILSGVFLLSISISSNAFTEQHALDDPANNLKVSNSTFSYSKNDGHSIITTIGTIKNLSNIRADELVVEIKYFDHSKKLIDTVTQPLYGVVVPPSQEVSFRVRDAADKSMDSYNSSSVRVVSAEQQSDRNSDSKKRSTFWMETFVSWLPMLLLIGVWIFFIKKMSRKDSPQKRTIELMEKQNITLTKQIEALERLASAVEKATSK